ncbi:MAG: molybdopterin-dependent oxidoreductase [Candidatus Krumholzibacteriota bacterium]
MTACPRNCYSTCSMRVTVEDGRLTAVEPVAANEATPEGPCLKGLSYVERQHSPDRILHPLRRRADGSFGRVSWDSALDEIADHLRRTRDEHGPQAIFHYAASGTKGLLNGCSLAFWRLFGGCTTTFGDLCWPAGLEATRLTLGENKHNAPWDLANAHLIIFWGKNAAETNIHQMRFVDQALDAGARLIVIDPRRTQTSERAELLIQPRPGTDGYLALAVARLLIEKGSIDREFIAGHVHGFEEFAAMAGERTVEEAAGVCDVPVAAIEKLADLLGSVKPATICAGFGMQRYTNSGQTMRALIALCAVTGNIGRPGAGWVYANLQTQVFGGARDPIAFFPPDNPDGVVRVSVSTARLGRDMQAQTDPPLKFAWVERGNPLAQNPETHAVRKAFRELDFRVVVEQFMTDTAREADIILPAKSMFEQTDVIGAYWHHYLQLRPAILDMAGEVKPETEIFRELARRLDIAGPGLDDAVPGSRDLETWLDRQLKPLDLTLADLKEGPVPAPGSENVVFTDRVFPTPSGKIELLSAEAAMHWGIDPLPRAHLPGETAAGADPDPATPLQMMTPNTKNRIHSQFGNLDLIRQYDPGPEVTMHPDDAAARGIEHGDRAKVFNQRGELELPVRIDAGIRRGCVSVTNGWWGEQGGLVNLLSAGRETDVAHGAAFHDTLVEVKKA